MVNTERKEHNMKDIFETILEKLSEMFPKQDYQSKLEQYIVSKNPTSVGEIEQLERQYYQHSSRSII